MKIWNAYVLNGWRLYVVAKEGKKWVTLIDFATLEQVRIERGHWGRLARAEVPIGSVKMFKRNLRAKLAEAKRHGRRVPTKVVKSLLA